MKQVVGKCLEHGCGDGNGISKIGDANNRYVHDEKNVVIIKPKGRQVYPAQQYS